MQVATRITASLPRPAAWRAPALIGVASSLLWLGGPRLANALAFDRAAIAGGAWWRLLTDNFVHLGAWHLLLNLLSLALLVALCPEPVRALDWCGRVALVGAGMSLGLYHLAPSVDHYVGLSGLVYGLFALGFGRQAAGGDRIAWVCLAFLGGRIAWELVVGIPASEQALIGGAVVAESHLYGVIAALLYGALFGSFRRTPATDEDNEKSWRERT